MNQILYAGYVLPGVANALKASGTSGEQALSTLRTTLCSVAMEAPAVIGKPPPADPVILTAAGIVSRGLPTFPSSEIQEEFDRGIGLTRSSTDTRGCIHGALDPSHPSTADRLHAALRSVLAGLSEAHKKGNGEKSAAGSINMLDDVLAKSGPEVTALLLSPLCMARIQRALLAQLLSGRLDLSAEQWRITVIERDFPGAALAVADLRMLFESLFALEGKGRSLPEISLTVYPAQSFAGSTLHRHAGATVVKQAEKLPPADCCIDVAVLAIPGQAHPAVPSDAAVHCTLRTAAEAGAARMFPTAEAVAWAPVTEPGKRDRIDAARHLLRRLFRLSDFREQQLPLLDLALRQRSMLVSLPAAAGKSLIYQFAALLQPARSLFIVPQSTLAIDQEQAMRDRCIDGVACIHESLAVEQRRQEMERTKTGEVFCTIVTAELFRDEQFTAVLQELRDGSVFFSQCVIDEAHTLSEWSHDSRFTMHGLVSAVAQRLRGGRKASVPVRLFTSSIGRDLIEDLRRQCAEAGRSCRLSDEAVVVDRRALNPAVHYAVFPAPVSGNAPRDLLQGKLGALDSLLQRLPAFFDELQSATSRDHRIPGFERDAFFSRDGRHAGVVFCPRPSGVLGVTSKFSPAGGEHTVAERISQDYLRVGAFIGKDEGVSHVGRQVLEEGAAERNRLREGEINLLIATGAFGIGIDNQNIRYAVHLSAPPSIERFVQESARAGHDGRTALAAVIYTPGGATRSADAAIAEHSLATTISNAPREKQLLHDLLREISYPEDSNAGRVANMIEDEFGINVRVNYWQRGLDERMYVHEAGGTCGYIDLVTQEIVPDPAVHDAEFARSILQFAHDVSLAAAGSGPSLSSWVSATFPSDIDDGIAQQMAEFDPDAEFTLRLGFENDREPLLNRIHQLLWHDADIQIQRKLLSQVSARSWTDFCSQLEMRSRKVGVFDALDADLEQRLIALFNKIRTRADTERVIQRLAMLGTVQDFTINAAARKFSLTMQVRREEEYRESLQSYMETFVPEAHVDRLLSALPQYPGDSMLERCLYFLVDFTYQQPMRRRQAAIAGMLHACEQGLQHGAASFRTTLDLSLRAKYARDDGLLRDIQKGKDRFTLLQDFLARIEEDESGSMLENAVHLESSCTELIQAGVNDPLLDALSSFATLLLCRSEAQLPDLRRTFVHAVTDCASASGLDASKYIDAVTPLFQLFRRYFSPEVTSQLRTELKAAAENIGKPSPRSISIPSARSGDGGRKKTPDLTAAPASSPKQGDDDGDVKTARTTKRTGRSETRGETHTADRREAEGGTEAPGRSERKEAAHRDRETRRDRITDSRRQTDEPASAEEAKEEKLTDDTDIEAILADLERTLGGEEDNTAKAASRHDVLDSRAGTGAPSAAKQRRGRDAKNRDEKAPAPEAESMAQRKPTAQSKPPVKKDVSGKAAAAVDPVLAETLTWLQTFNHRFLKDYESRNARITAGS